MKRTPTIVYKFGGAALSTPKSIRSTLRIILQRPLDCTLIVVVSAMGKTTNALENALTHALETPSSITEALMPIRKLHEELAIAILGQESEGTQAVHQRLQELQLLLTHLPNAGYEVLYDMVIPYGEMLSSILMAHAIRNAIGPTQWVDARTILRSDSVHRSATVQTYPSSALCRQAFTPTAGALYITQGFIASSIGGETTTLGREGSDYTAALIGQFIGAHSVTIWKDVPGFLTADPKLFPHAQLIDVLDYREAIEMAYAGAKVVHPKAIKPLQNASIPLHIRPYNTPDAPGSTITNLPANAPRPQPLIALRTQQAILSIAPIDLSFAVQDALGDIFHQLQAHHIQINLVQTSAVSLSVCVDNDPARLSNTLEALQLHFRVTFNTDLVLLAIRHPNEAIRNLFTINHEEIMASQTTRSTAQYVLRRPIWEKYYPKLLDATAPSESQ